MPVSKAQQKAVNKYMAANYDRINLTVPKGEKDRIQAHAAAQGESVNAFINRAIDHEIARDSSGSPQEGREEPPGAGVVSLPSETLETAQRAAETAGEAVPVFLARAVETQAQRAAMGRRMMPAAQPGASDRGAGDE